MHYNKTQNFIAAKDCPFKLSGQNLVELRRAKLRPIAKALGTSADGTKNEILIGLIARLRTLESDEEIMDFFKRASEEKAKPKKKAKKVKAKK